MAQLSYPLDNTYYTASYPQFWLSTRTRGVFSSNDLSVTVLSGMTITVNVGIAWLKFSRFVSAGFANTSTVNFTLDTADGLYKRIDRVVIRWSNITNDITLQVKKGTNGSNPVAPALQNDSNIIEMALADITINAGVLQLTQSNITDQRLNESLCGIMRDGVTGIPTQTLYDQWFSWFSQLKSNAEKSVSDFTNWMQLFRAQNESDLAAWLTSFKTRSESEFNDWFNSFRSANSTIFNNWYNAFVTESESDFNTWFADLQNTLDENQASNLYNKIDTHERLTADSQPDGVHGIRITPEGKVQYLIGAGWTTIGMIVFGYSWQYIDELNKMWQEWDLNNYTWAEIEKLVEVEV